MRKSLRPSRPSSPARRGLRGYKRAPAALLFSVLWLASLILSACTPASAATPTPNLVLTAAFQEALDQATHSVPTATATITPSPVPPTATATATAIRTPPALPALFTSDLVAKNVTPQTYIKNTCQYLKARWDPNNSAPGTVVMTIMYHSVTEDYNQLLPDGSQVHHSDVAQALEHAHEVGFQTITTTQLADFLDYNAKIPRRSLLIIVDDRKRKAFYESHFIPFLEKFGWTMTNAWISAKDTPDYLWQENKEVIDAGWVDPQAHGVVHNVNIGEYSTDDFIRGEMSGSVEAIQKHFGKHPYAFIWPGGGFTKRAVDLAHEIGYRVGFTTNPRGPVMYNWVPQSDKLDPEHTSWLPEVAAGDPRMTLPRYWSSDAAYRIDDVINVGEQAEAYAAQNKATELEYYDIVCKGTTGLIPTEGSTAVPTNAAEPSPTLTEAPTSAPTAIPATATVGAAQPAAPAEAPTEAASTSQ